MVGDLNDGQPACPRSTGSPIDASPSTSVRHPVEHTATESTAMLRSLLGVFDDTRLTSHSLKTTCLSWCAKADVSREHRRILGRHTSAVVDADSIYSRDLMYGPVVALEKVMSAICESVKEGSTRMHRGVNVGQLHCPFVVPQSQQSSKGQGWCL